MFFHIKNKNAAHVDLNTSILYLNGEAPFNRLISNLYTHKTKKKLPNQGIIHLLKTPNTKKKLQILWNFT